MNGMGVHHIAVKVADLLGAEAFYKDLIGLPVIRRWPALSEGEGPRERSLWLDLGSGVFLALEQAGQGEGAKTEDAPGIHLVALRIARDQREAWATKLAQAGHPVYQKTAYTLYVRDPEGNRVGLSHWPDPI